MRVCSFCKFLPASFQAARTEVDTVEAVVRLWSITALVSTFTVAWSLMNHIDYDHHQQHHYQQQQYYNAIFITLPYGTEHNREIYLTLKIS